MREELSASQTKDSFAQKWTHSHDFQVGPETLDSDTLGWILGRNGFSSLSELSSFLAGRTRILDAGCGNGRILNLLASHAPRESTLVGLDLAAAEIARKNLIGRPNVEVRPHDLLQPIPSDLQPFDFVYCQEVLHHTGDPFVAFSHLYDSLSDGGIIAIYVYRKKGPIREYSDDFIHEQIKDLSYAEAEPIMRSLQILGRKLAELGAEVELPEIPILGIPAGTHDVQRLVYNYFLKCYWNPELNDDANTMINFDWYHPSFSSRHTLDEVEGWFREKNLEILRSYVDPYGITVHGRR
jgi:SAM-dependent methyltransferase